MEIAVYTPQTTSRIKYTFYLMLREVCNAAKVSIVDDLDAFEKMDGPKINYSKEEIEGAVWFWPAGLLNEKDISEQEIYMSSHRDLPIFYGVSHGVLPFDPFAAAFYLVSRYEEYLPFISDEHNRFMAKESLAFKEGFLQKPVVNIWGKWIREEIVKQFPEASFEKRQYNFISTVDVDNLYAYKGKGVVRTGGAMVREWLTLKWSRMFERTKSAFGFAPDPFNTFLRQMEANEKAKVPSIYFMLFAEFARFDRNISMYSPRMYRAVREMNDYTEVAIHPSYQSNENDKIVAKEVRHLEHVVRTPITKSRQHFLKLRFPDTFRNLVELGIKDEFSMGYASDSGFRASIATPFTFYDLELEVPVPLTIHPFAVMDVTYIDYKKVPKEQALAEMKKMVDEVKSVDGQMVSVFHNRVFSEYELAWKGWFSLYEEFIAYAAP